MRAWLVVVCALAGCGSGQRIDECDRLVAVVEKISSCKRLDRAQRLQIDQALKVIREALDKLDDVGLDQAPPETVNASRQSCGKQREDLERAYQKSAPDCLQ